MERTSFWGQALTAARDATLGLKRIVRLSQPKVYYTPKVKKKVPNLPTMVDSVIGKTNQGYINSKIPIRIRLHCLEQTEQSK